MRRREIVAGQVRAFDETQEYCECSEGLRCEAQP